MRFIYDVLAIGLILLLGIFSLNYYGQYYPLYLEVYDIAYHLAQAVGMDRAGGLTLTSFWQEAVHLAPAYYPPFFHFCNLLLLRSGASINFLGKYFIWILYPLALFSFWSFMSICFSSRVGFYSLMLFSLPALFMQKIWGHPTFGLFCVLLPLVFLSLLKRRYITTLMLIFLSLATHLSAGMILLVLFIYALHSHKDIKIIFLLLATLLVLASPLLWIVLKRISFYSFFPSLGINRIFKAIIGLEGFDTFFDYKRQYYVYLGILAALGVLVSYFRRGNYLIFPSLFIALVLINSLAGNGGDPAAFRYNQMLPMLIFPMLGGVILDEAHAQLQETKFLSKFSGRFLGLKAMVILLIITSIAHILFYSLSAQPRYNRAPTLLFLNWPKIWLPYQLLFTTEQRTRLLELIKENVVEEEMVYNTVGINSTNMLSASSRRSFTRDIKASPKMLVTEKAPSGYILLEKMNPQFSVYTLKDKNKAGKASVPKPILSFAWMRNGFILLGISIFMDLILGKK